MSRMGKESARTGDVFLRAHRIDFIFDSIVLAGNGNDARAMHGTGGGAKRGETESQVVPGKVEGVGERRNGDGCEKGTTEKIHRWGTSGQVWVGHGRSLQATGTKWTPMRARGAWEGANRAETRSWRESAQSSEMAYVAQIRVSVCVGARRPGRWRAGVIADQCSAEDSSRAYSVLLRFQASPCATTLLLP
jgi:hypothetical protein